MSIWIISDLHLSFSVPKPMDIFGEQWLQHYDKIKTSWLEKVAPDDTVILPGDTSWALHFSNAMVDLAWIEALPGKKLLLRGNHDYWWSTLTKMRKAFTSIDYLQNNSYVVEGIGIVGTRGWLSPTDWEATEDDKRIFERELLRLKLSLDSLPRGIEQIIAVVHFPPFDENGKPNAIIDVLAPYPVKAIYYGHVHTTFDSCAPKTFGGIPCLCTSCDYLDFKLQPILKEA